LDIKAWFKSKTADKVLAPVREAIIGTLKHNRDSENDCVLLDLGCGTGDLLFKAQKSIQLGIGIDLDPSMIRFAEAKKQSLKANQLVFIHADINAYPELGQFNITTSTSTLCIHEMAESDAIHSLQSLAQYSTSILVADYAEAKSLWSKISIEFDEMISGHYSQFRKYRQNGYLPYLADKAKLEIDQVIETAIDGIFIWQLCPRKDNAS
jgi:ubiquinone/menaquinone biosynthesis C-methylase UbiE